MAEDFLDDEKLHEVAAAWEGHEGAGGTAVHRTNLLACSLVTLRVFVQLLAVLIASCVSVSCVGHSLFASDSDQVSQFNLCVSETHCVAAYVADKLQALVQPNADSAGFLSYADSSSKDDRT